MASPSKKKAQNIDLWDRLLLQLDKHHVSVYFRDDTSDKHVERAYALARAAVTQGNLAIDDNYELRLAAESATITEAGQACLLCGAPVVRKVRKGNSKALKEGVLGFYLVCPECKKRYTVNAANQSLEGSRERVPA